MLKPIRRIAVTIIIFASVILAAQFANRPLVSGPVTPNPKLFPADANAKADIRRALLKAARQKKRVILEFGALWCYDCHVLDHAFHSIEIAPLLNANFVVVHVDVGKYDKNLDLAKKYDVPLEKGVPALAVLASNGKLLYSQQNHEFSAARKMSVQEVRAFLNQWKPGK